MFPAGVCGACFPVPGARAAHSARRAPHSLAHRQVRTDLSRPHAAICSPEVAVAFSDNCDYQASLLKWFRKRLMLRSDSVFPCRARTAHPVGRPVRPSSGHSQPRGGRLELTDFFGARAQYKEQHTQTPNTNTRNRPTDRPKNNRRQTFERDFVVGTLAEEELGNHIYLHVAQRGRA